MRFTCSKKDIHEKLNLVIKSITNRTTMPILKGILIEAKEEEILIKGTDLEISILSKLKIKNDEVGKIIVNAKLFYEIIRKLPEGNIEFFTDKSKKIHIKNLNSEFELEYLEEEKFPFAKEVKGEKFSFDRDILCNMIKKSSSCVSRESTKNALRGLYIEINKTGISLVGSDGYRIAITKGNIINEQEKDILVPVENILNIEKILREEKETVELIIGEKDIKFELKEGEIYLKLLEGTYIDYKKPFLEEMKTEVIINKNDLINAVERMYLLSPEKKNNKIILRLINNLLKIETSSDIGYAKEEIIVDKMGEDNEFAINCKFLLDAIKNIDGEELKLKIGKNERFILIEEVENDRSQFLIMNLKK